jgi:hypothetical protein
MSSIGLIGYSFIKKLIEEIEQIELIELTQPAKHSKLDNPLTRKLGNPETN